MAARAMGAVERPMRWRLRRVAGGVFNMVASSFAATAVAWSSQRFNERPPDAFTAEAQKDCAPL